ncbi:hypothetical protein VOLCADRAFT_95412 [Volvox carteri f. nagariensis]|uniref:Uncharacterized protein ssa5 n=1 Tax=Volvox carteri f. nagariensis TaxID=3068 RepID=D8U7D6_VOLCA|nr:uncharacterized protein VOLCADRAFT_95412 [Volvox carteri f. nagariensis]EFJ44403.1 hypothetical protein VOLCADRAFT_95412 [Volvox carteri f. nagariensis]|eukprot:XP_002954510.1 hypothetical protein VOLCADRAFT_95412 [Volvox carteri f. nagariensis]
MAAPVGSLQILQNIVWRPDSPPEVDARYRGDRPPAPGGEPDYFRVWMWNLTNLQAVRGGAKPNMVEVGPLTYVKSRVRLDPRWDRNGRVAVKEWDYHVFVPELSAASPDDVIVTLNLPLLGVLEVLHSYSISTPGVRPLLDVLVGVLSAWRDSHVDGLFTKRTAQELLWGYEDPLLQRLSVLLGPAYLPPGGSWVALLRNLTEQEVRTNKMEMESGWSAVSSWGPNCTEYVRGTDAFQFRPGLDRTSVLRVWIAELFRSAELVHVADEELYGIQLLRFIPETREAEPDPCHHQLIRALANVTVPMPLGPGGNGSSETAHGVPILMSLPHYCLVDEWVSAALTGMSCDPLRHGIFLDVEPTTGITMRAAKRLQLSSQITTSARMTLEPTITTSIILPIFWAEEASRISPSQAAAFRSTVYRAQRIAAATRRWSYPAAGLTAVLAAAAVLAASLASPSRRRRAPLHLLRRTGGNGEAGGDVNGGTADGTSAATAAAAAAATVPSGPGPVSDSAAPRSQCPYCTVRTAAPDEPNRVMMEAEED